MRKTLAFIMTLILCIGLCACGNEDAAHTEYPKDWDRIAEATATLNQYYACQTEEEFRAVLHSEVSDSTLKMIMDSMNEYRQIQEESIGDYEQYVRKIKFVETHNGCDIFFVSDGFETADGFRTPDQPLPEIKAPNYGMLSMSGTSWSIFALVVENGQYVLANSPETDWASYYATIVQCTCDLGTVVVPGDPCKGCNGEGFLTEQPDANAENEDDGVCETCGGNGWIERTDTVEDVTDSNQQSVALEIVPCPDCSLTLGNMFVGADGIVRPNIQTVEPCTDCEGTGLENYTYGDCPLCNGVGYTRSGN